MSTVVVYGPVACGKTYHAARFMETFGCEHLVDEFMPSVPVKDGSLVLTSMLPDAILKFFQKTDTCILSFEWALRICDKVAPMVEIELAKSTYERLVEIQKQQGHKTVEQTLEVVLRSYLGG
jgi:hypothetical protein